MTSGWTLAGCFVFAAALWLGIPATVLAQGCPPNAYVYKTERQGEEIVHRCKCYENYVKSQGRCRPLHPPVQIGAASAVQGEVLIEQPDGSWKQIHSGTTIYSYNHLKTGPNGKVQFMLLDETVFTVGAKTELLLDEFVYDPDVDFNSVTARIIKGIFRFVTGKIARKKPSKVKVNFSVGTLGGRGTDFIAKHDPTTNRSTVYLHEGKFEFTPTATGKTTQFSAGQIVVIDETGIIEVMLLSDQKWKQAVRKEIGSVGSAK